MAQGWDLVHRLKNLDDADGWRDFITRYWRSLLSTAMRRGCNRAEAEDAAQETLTSVASRIQTFRTDPAVGSFHSWVMRIAHCRIADQFRRRVKHSRTQTESRAWIDAEVESVTIADEETNAWEQRWMEQARLELLNAAMNSVRAQVKPKSFEAYRLALCEELSVSEIAARLGLRKEDVYLAKHRVGILIKKAVRRIKTEEATSATTTTAHTLRAGTDRRIPWSQERRSPQRS